MQTCSIRSWLESIRFSAASSCSTPVAAAAPAVTSSSRFAPGGRNAPWACLQLLATFVQFGQTATARATLEGACEGRQDLLDLILGSWPGRGNQAVASLERARLSADVRWPATLELARLTMRHGCTEKARRLLEASRRHYSRGGDDWGHASTLARQASLALYLHNPTRAIELARRAAAMRDRAGDRLGLGFALQVQAKAHYVQSEYVAAMDTLRQALAVHQTAGHHLEAAVTLNNIGLWQLDLANPHQAREAFLKARKLLRRIHERFREGITLANLGNASRQLGHLGACDAYYRSALDLLVDGDPNAYGIALAEVAEGHTQRGRPDRALDALRRAPARAGRRTQLLLDIETTRALIAARQTRRAVRLSEQVVKAARRLPGTDPTRLISRVRAETIHGAALLAAGRHAEAVAIGRRVSRRIDSLLAKQSNAAVRMGLVETYRDAQNVLCQSLLAHASPARAWRTVSRSKGRELGDPKTAPGARDWGAASKLPADTALIEYHVGRSTTHVFIVHRGRVRVVELGVSEAELDRAIEQTLAPLRRVGAADTDPLAELESFDLGRARALFRRLLQPAVAVLPAVVQRLLIVPDGPLHGLPFELLVVGEGRPVSPSHPSIARFDAPEYLIERYVVSYAVSSQYLSGDGDHATERFRFLGLAHSPRSAELRTPEGPVLLQPLDGVVDECRAAAEHFPDSTLLAGLAATVLAYADRAGGHDIIHVAAHAIADPRGPGLSGVVMAPADDQPFGFLTAELIRRTPLRADLVVLSACDTGRGQLRAREGILGLGRAFLDAGAKAVIATQWPVDDSATRTLMTDFYRMLRRGASPAKSLASAKRRLRDRCDEHLFPTRAHPFYWASFVLIER